MIDVPVEPHPFAFALDWLAGVRRRSCLLLGSGRWTAADPVPSRRAELTRPPLKGERDVIRHDPADPVGSAPHSADLAPLPDRDDLVRLSADGPLRWHGTPRVTRTATADVPVERVATLVHERPDGVATRLADGTAPLGAGPSDCEIRLSPGAVDLPAGHRLHLELTAGRPPRYAAPARGGRIEPRDVELRLPLPREGAFA